MPSQLPLRNFLFFCFNETRVPGDATAPYWKAKLGWILEQIGKFLQQSAASYSSEDGAATSQDITVGQIRRVAEVLNKAADAIEKGEKFELF